MNVGGPALHVTQLATGLDSQRFTQLLVTGVESPGEASTLPAARARGVAALVLPELGRELSVRRDAVTLLKLYRLFRRWRPDVVETHTAKAGTVGRLAAFLAGVPVRIHVFHGHVFHSYFSPAKTQMILEIERRLASISTRIITLSERQRREVLSYGVGRPDQVLVVPLGLDLAPLLDAQRHQGALGAELGLEGDHENCPLLGIVGRLAPIKAHEVFLAAAAQIVRQVPGAHFVVIGDGERRGELEAIAARPPLAGHVHFLGWRDDLPAVYAGLEVVLLTSDNEGTPTVILEAMAAGRPIVATAVGGVPDLVQDGETGRLVRPRDPAAVAEASLALLGSPEERRRLGAAARAAVYPRYDVRTLLDTMNALYSALARLASTRE